MRGWKEGAWVMGLYTAFTGAFFYPTLSSFSTDLIGPPEDNMQFFWFLWYGGQALLDPDLPFLKSPFVYFPEGFDLLFANYYYYGVFLSGFLKFFLNTIQIYNLLILHSFVFAGSCCFRVDQP